MKAPLSLLCAGLLAGAVNTALATVEETVEWEEVFPVSAGAELSVRNVWGPVNITRGPAGAITVRAVETRSAPNQTLFERSKSILYVHLENSDELVKLAIGDQDHKQRWRRDNPCRGCKLEIAYTIEVPTDTLVSAATVNDGGIVIKELPGPINAENINGPVTITGLHACSDIQNINGEVRLTFATAPDLPCEIETINGDINISLPQGAGLDVLADLGNGDLRTSLHPEALPVAAKLTEEREGRKTSYRVTQAAGIRLGPGGHPFTIRSMNGDVRINPVK
ncbi:MAG: hypothetical protein AAGA23_21645 [Pseudomonadota bacterium]